MTHGFRRGSQWDEPAARLRVITAGSGPLPGAPRRVLPGPAEGWGSGDEDKPGDEVQPPGEPTVPAGDIDEDWPGADEPSRRPGAVGGLARAPGRLHEFGRAHFGVVAVVCAVILVFGLTQVLRARATTVDSPSPSVQAEATGTPQAESAGPAPQDQSPAAIRVHVIGAVQAPGVVQVPAGARVADAIDAAGGFSADADPGELNQAQPVSDGCQIVIGTTAAPRGELNPPGSSSGQAAGDPAASGQAGAGRDELIDLNSATAAQLEELSGIGPVLAERIVEWRTEHGRFSRVEELQEVSGIGEKLYARIKDHVRV